MESSTWASISRSDKPPRELDDTVSQGGLSVINMGNNGKITDVFHQHNQ